MLKHHEYETTIQQLYISPIQTLTESLDPIQSLILELIP